MARMGGMRGTKRSKAPGFWRVPRKEYRFTITPSPGPHRRSECYPLGVLIRDILGFVKTAGEAEASIREGAILVDGVKRRDSRFPVGLMDVVEIPSVGKVYRMVPKAGSTLMPLEVVESEKSLKLCKVKSKTTVRGGVVQYALHDGRSLLADDKLNMAPGDSCIIEVPSQKVEKTLKMENDALVMVIRGEKAGLIGKVKGLKQGTFTRLRLATIAFDEGTVELPMNLLVAIGRGEPAIQVA